MYKLDGKYIEYYKNGNKKIEKNYKDGKLNGTYTKYYKIGNKKLEIFDLIKGYSSTFCLKYSSIRSSGIKSINFFRFRLRCWGIG